MKPNLSDHLDPAHQLRNPETPLGIGLTQRRAERPLHSKPSRSEPAEMALFVLRFVSACDLPDHRDLLPFEILPHGGSSTRVEQINYFRMDVSFLIRPKSRVLYTQHPPIPRGFGVRWGASVPQRLSDRRVAGLLRAATDS